MANIDFTYNVSDIDSVKDEIKDKITIDTYEIDVPQKLYEVWADLINALENNITSNINNLIDKFEEYWNQQAEELKTEIENNLALDPSKTYNIHVTYADKADDSNKLAGKTYQDIVTDIVSNYITTATVANSIKFNNYTFDDLINYIKTNVKVNSASNADTLNNLTYDQLKADIISNIQTENIDFDAIQNKVENEWTAYKAKLALTFGDSSWDANYWKENIIPSIKVNNSTYADYLVYDSKNYSLNDIQNIITTKVSDYVDSKVNSSNTEFVNLIKNIKVNNAVNADNAITATKLGSYTDSSLIDHIQNDIEVLNATQAKYLLDSNNTKKTYEDITTYISTQITSLKTDLTAGNLIPAIAQTVNELDGKTIDDFKQEILDEAKQAAADNTDAETLQGYTFDDLINYIKSNVKVDNALNSDQLNGFTYDAVYADFKTKLEYDLVPNLAKKLTSNGLFDSYIYEIFNTTDLDALLYDPLKVTEPDDGFNTFILVSNEVYAQPANKQEFQYDDNNNLIKIIYYFNYDPNADEQKPFINYFREDIFTYDNDNKLTEEQKIFYYRYNENEYTDFENATNYKITITKTFEYDSNNNLITIDYNSTIEEYTD